jgi:excisionase family DNA binding protein
MSKVRGKRSLGPFLLRVRSRTFVRRMDEMIDWMSSADAAEYLGVQPRTLYRFIDEGRVVAYRFGRVIRLKRVDVEEFVRSCRIEPGTLSETTSIPSTTT